MTPEESGLKRGIDEELVYGIIVPNFIEDGTFTVDHFNRLSSASLSRRIAMAGGVGPYLGPKQACFATT